MKNLLFFKSTLLTVICVFFFNVSQAQSLASKIDKILTNQFKNNETGVSALVAKDGKVLYRKAFGKANLELDVDMTSDNVFEIGSITKQFTSVSILMLLEEGKLSLDDEITKFIPDYPTNGNKITIHHLLTHTSGIKSYTSMQSFGEIATIDKTPLEFINFFKNEPMDFDPGEKYLYNNSAYFILGYIIEKVSGISYEKFLQERIFDKINMKSSYYGSHTKLIKNRASGYEKGADFVNAQYISLTLPYAAGSIMSTVDDMLKWQTAITNNVFVKKETIAKAFTNYTLNNGDKINYGYGWSLDELNDVPTIEHGGAIPGYLSMGVFVPSENVYVILFSNCGCQSPTNTALEIAALAINKPKFEAGKEVKLSIEQLNNWVGTYEFDAKVLRFITLKDGQLYSQREGSPKSFKIFPTSPTSFTFEEGFISYDFSIKDGKKVALFKNRINKVEGIFTDKVATKEKEIITVSADVLKTYEGVYEIQPGFDLTITAKENQLFAQATGQAQFELFATTETNFFLKVVKAEIEFHKNEKDEIIALTLYQGGNAMKAMKK
ncbi:CubicO group peptidase, beta-lactamase class C family [Polaribacter sp. KT25b]|uniref:serine hydrolase n=1 Tax=Polaribacter sp. KT25b TaxID=1855336 RepID=UPI000879F07B|nr:serine hydrolase [Polaribacter sp. KT25b]SDS15783.1 CubicO group peptidase, beta-lactamase class C family [Polaribacter sp. KT25b]